MSKLKQVEGELRKLSPEKLRQVRDWLEDFLEDQLEFTTEFEAATRQAKPKTKTVASPRKRSSNAARRKT